MTLTLSEVLFIYNKQLLIKIIARSSSHLSSDLVITGIQRGGYYECPLPLTCSLPLLPSSVLPVPTSPLTPVLLQAIGIQVVRVQSVGWMSKSSFDFTLTKYDI